MHLREQHTRDYRAAITLKSHTTSLYRRKGISDLTWIVTNFNDCINTSVGCISVNQQHRLTHIAHSYQGRYHTTNLTRRPKHITIWRKKWMSHENQDGSWQTCGPKEISDIDLFQIQIEPQMARAISLNGQKGCKCGSFISLQMEGVL